MSGKAGTAGNGEHGNALIEGVTTAISWMTIIPAKGAATFDRITGARTMAALPVAGLLLGLLSALPAAALLYLGTAPLLIAAMTVIGWELGSRMMHIDGLADVGDALGSYAEPARAQEILGDKYTGALGVGAVLLTLLAQVAGLAAVLANADVRVAALIVFLPALGRAIAMMGCHRSFKPFSTTGFGSLIIGTVRPWWTYSWLVVLSSATGFAVWGVDKHLAWGALAATVVAAAGTAVFLRHCNKRFNGLNGDCIGAGIELAVALAAVTLGIAS